MTKGYIIKTTVFLTVIVLMAGCGGGKEKKEAQAAADAQATAAEQMAKAAEAMQAQSAASANVELVDFKKLKELLPEEIAGNKRSDLEGEKNEAMGVRISMARARYSGEKNRSIRVEISDMAGMAGAAAMAQFGWSSVSIDRETDNGYEKTTTVSGHKAFENYNQKSRNGQLQIVVASRFMVSIEGSDIEAEALQATAKALPLNKLAGMAK